MEIKVKNLINDNGNSTPNQFVIIIGRDIYFQSYDSIICKLHNGEVILTKKWDYSYTTRKHLYMFLRNYSNYYVYGKKDILSLIKEKKFIVKNNLSLK